MSSQNRETFLVEARRGWKDEVKGKVREIQGMRTQITIFAFEGEHKSGNAGSF